MEPLGLGRWVISKLYGGLGNQMFQYAAGRALAIRSNSTLLLDKRFFDAHQSTSFDLDRFNIRRVVGTGKFPPYHKENKLLYFLWRHLKPGPQLVRETSPSFDNRLLKPLSGVYLDGYWQSERYFSDVAETIREDLRIITPPSPENAVHLAGIAVCPAVSLHVRRGDYLWPEHETLHGTCSMDYYAKALELVASHMAAEPVVYVFSDEPDWARDNLVLPFEKRVMSHNTTATSYEDMRLMSACRHHIIANSTFSWWGAWLNPSPEKIVVAPQRWFADPKIDNPDIIPDGWRRVAG